MGRNVEICNFKIHGKCDSLLNQNVERNSILSGCPCCANAVVSGQADVLQLVAAVCHSDGVTPARPDLFDQGFPESDHWIFVCISVDWVRSRTLSLGWISFRLQSDCRSNHSFSFSVLQLSVVQPGQWP